MKCSRLNCNSGMPAQWKPVLLMWPEGYAQMQCQPISMDLNDLLVCHACTKTLTVKDLTPPPKAWRDICQAIMASGKRKPSLQTAKVTFLNPEADLKGLRV